MKSLCNLSEQIISHSVAESIKNKDEYSEIDIGIGVLYIKQEDSGVVYKFVPSNKLQSIVSDTIKDGESRLVGAIDESLGRHISNTYKDLF